MFFYIVILDFRPQADPPWAEIRNIITERDPDPPVGGKFRMTFLRYWGLALGELAKFSWLPGAVLLFYHFLFQLKLKAVYLLSLAHKNQLYYQNIF